MTGDSLPYTQTFAVGVLREYGAPDEIRDQISKLEITKDKATAPDVYGSALEDL